MNRRFPTFEEAVHYANGRQAEGYLAEVCQEAPAGGAVPAGGFLVVVSEAAADQGGEAAPPSRGVLIFMRLARFLVIAGLCAVALWCAMELVHWLLAGGWRPALSIALGATVVFFLLVAWSAFLSEGVWMSRSGRGRPVVLLALLALVAVLMLGILIVF